MTGPNGLGDLMRDPEETIRRMDDWAAGFAAKAQRYQAAQEQTERLRLTATSSDGAVSVTVGADGTVTDLTFSNKAKSFPLEELSRQILTTMRRAQSGIADRVAGVMAEQLGDEDRETRSAVLDNLRGRFPGHGRHGSRCQGRQGRQRQGTQGGRLPRERRPELLRGRAGGGTAGDRRLEEPGLEVTV